MSKLKNLISNLYNRYMDEVDDYEELEDEYGVTDLEEEEEYRARRAERRRQSEDGEEGSESKTEASFVREQPDFEGTILTSKANLYDYSKEGKVCCHCDSSLEKGIVSEKDQWEMSYTICPSCQFVNRIEPNGDAVYPSSELAEMKHAMALFAQKGHVFNHFNTQEEEEALAQSASF